MEDGGILAFDRVDTATVPNAISGPGALRQIGAGTTILTGANTWPGGTTITAGTLQIGADGTSGALGTGDVVNNGVLAFDRSDTVTVSDTISGTGALWQTGTGTVVLTGASTYTGPTSVTAGKLRLEASASLGDTAISVGKFAALAAAPGGGMITIGVGGASLALGAGSTLDLRDAAVGRLDIDGAGSGFTLATTSVSVAGISYPLSLANSTATNLVLTVGAANTAPIYWSGTIVVPGLGVYWNSLSGGNSNFVTAPSGGSAVTTLPGPMSNVVFAATSATNLTTSLGQDFSIRSLTFSTAGNVVIASRNLTLGDGGLTVAAGSGSHVIRTNDVILGASQTWTNYSANPLTIRTNIDSAPSAVLTIAGTGVIEADDALNVDRINLAGGTLRFVDGSYPNPDSTRLVFSGGTLDVETSNYTALGSLSGYGTLTTSMSDSSTFLSVSQNEAGVFSGVIHASSSSGFDLIKRGSEPLTLTGSTEGVFYLAVAEGALNIRGGKYGGVGPDGSADPSVIGGIGIAGGTSATISDGSIVYANIEGGSTGPDISHLTISGPATQVTGNLTANSGYADFRIEQGASVTGDVSVSSYSSDAVPTASLVISDPGSKLTSYGWLLMDNANLSVLNGAIVSGTHGSFGSESNHNATALVSGAGSFWQMGSLSMVYNSLTNAHTVITVADGGELNVAGDFRILGTVNVGAPGGGLAGRLVVSTVNSASSGEIDFNQTDTVHPQIGLAGAVAVNQRGTGLTILDGTNASTGATTISAGTLEFARRVSLYNATPANWTAAKLIVSTGATAAFNVGGAGEFTAADLDALKALGTPSGGFEPGAILGIDTTNAPGGAFTYFSNIADPNAGANALGLAKLGEGTLVLSGDSSYSGGTTIYAGTLVVGNDHALGASTGAVVVKGGVLQIQGGVAIANMITLAGGSLAQQLADHASFASLGGYESNISGGVATGANFLGGTSSAPANLQTSFAAVSPASNDTLRLSQVFTLSGVPVVDLSTGATDVFVLQLTLPDVTADSYLAWYNPDPAVSRWVNAVKGNIGGTDIFAGDRAYDPATDFHLGTWGLDVSSDTVWAVLNHNSDFSIVAIPEPREWGEDLAGMLAVIALTRGRKAAGAPRKQPLPNTI